MDLEKLKGKAKKKIILWLLSAALPLIGLLFLAGCLLPLFAFGGDVLQQDSNDFYSGAEMGIASYKVTDKGTYKFPLDLTKVQISSGFGERIHPITKVKSFHAGIDMPCAEGTNVFAADDGVVNFAGTQSGYGNVIIIKHGNGYTTLYGHLSKILIKDGDNIKRGQIIGLSGNTGDSTGPHLHFEVHDENDVPTDPAKFLGLVSDIPNVLPDELKYVDVNVSALKAWLNNQNSILADGMYCDDIIRAAKEYNVNPLLLIAITGQEESFVPRSWNNAGRIANNPFNVYHSWYEYNTSTYDSARIASKTILSLSKGRPETVQPILWINREYAEDKNWWVGVTKFFDILRNDGKIKGK